MTFLPKARLSEESRVNNHVWHDTLLFDSAKKKNEKRKGSASTGARAQGPSFKNARLSRENSPCNQWAQSCAIRGPVAS